MWRRSSSGCGLLSGTSKRAFDCIPLFVHSGGGCTRHGCSLFFLCPRTGCSLAAAHPVSRITVSVCMTNAHLQTCSSVFANLYLSICNVASQYLDSCKYVFAEKQPCGCRLATARLLWNRVPGCALFYGSELIDGMGVVSVSRTKHGGGEMGLVGAVGKVHGLQADGSPKGVGGFVLSYHGSVQAVCRI